MNHITLRNLLHGSYQDAWTLRRRVYSFYEDEENEEISGEEDDKFILREAEWVIEDFNDTCHVLHYRLLWARRLLRSTKDGKEIPLDWNFQPKRGFTPTDIEMARETIQDYELTKQFLKEARKWHSQNRKSGG